MAKLVSTTYGDALFELALEENKLEAMLEEVQAVKKIFNENEELGRLLSHPEVDKEEKIHLIENIFKGRCSDDMTGFLVLVLEKGRQKDLDGIFTYFIHKAKEYQGIGTAFVSSAVPLSEEQKKAVEERLLSLTKYHRFEMNYQVEPELIGGLVLRIEDRVIDSSIRTQLLEMKKSLSKIQLQ
ncbi:MAG: ATP synthase F1 subunit delta [Lachnospiraceae bacterium]|nr:ATP synthase F1 subunit delta [Lachnospiraceae bacterium]